MNYFLVRDDQLYEFLTNDFIIKTLENSHIMDKPDIQKLLYDAIEAENEKYGVCGLEKLAPIWAEQYRSAKLVKGD